MRKAMILVVVLLLPCSFFALSREVVFSHLKEMIRDYEGKTFSDPFVRYVEENIHLLKLYRFYKKALVGSVERTEFARSVGDYLHVIYTNWREEDTTKDLANVLFLAYLQAKMSLSTDPESVLKNSPSFTSFFYRYGDFVREQGSTLLEWLFAYHTGGTKEEPPILLDIPVIDLGFNYPITPQEINPEVLSFFDEAIKEKIATVLRNEFTRVVDESEYVRTIRRQVNFLLRDLNERVAIVQNTIAQEFKGFFPKKPDLWWLRFVIYAIFFYIFRKKISVLIAVIGSLEIAILWLRESLFLDTIETAVYSSVLFFAFLFLCVLLLKRRRFLSLALIGIFVSLAFVPSHLFVRELAMDENFEKSPFYTSLKVDVFEDETSPLKSNLKRLMSLLYASREQTSQLVLYLSYLPEKFLEAGALEVFEHDPYYGTYADTPLFSEFYSPKNFQRRIATFKEVESAVSDYIIEERNREKSYRSLLDRIKRQVRRITSYTSDRFTEDLYSSLERSLKRDALSAVVYREISMKTTKKPFSLKPYQTSSGTKKLVGFFLLVLLVAVIGNKKWVLLPIVTFNVGVIWSILRWRDLSIFVEGGLYPMSVHTLSASYIPLMDIFAFLVSAILIHRTLKGRDVL